MRQAPLRHQLALVVTLTSGLAVGLAATTAVWLEARGAFEEITRQFLPIARIVGSNSVGALSFNDSQAAVETLAALATTQSVVGARLYTPAGRPFATYVRPGRESDAVPEQPGTPGHRFERGHLVLFEEILHDGERAGWLYMKVDGSQKLQELWRSAELLGLVFLASTGAALLLSTRLQRRISRPILELASAARAASERRDYGVRVPVAGPIELQDLTSAFNEMLAQIQERDAALRAARDELEQRVEQRVQELRLQGAALESTADAVAITDREGLVRWVNPSFSALTGFEAAAAFGLPVTAFRSEKREDAAPFKEMTRTVLEGRLWDGELTNRRKDGSLYVAGVTVTPVRDTAGRISHYVAVMRDVSQRRRLEDQLRQAQKMEAVGRLSGGVAHDFNNILNVIIGFGDMLLKRLPDDERLRRYGHEILKAGNRGAALTRQLLAFSRQQVLQPKVLDLNLVIADLGKMLARLIGEDIEVVTSLDPALGRVEVDPGQIEQVLMNLVVNARDAMPRGGTLAIQTANLHLGAQDPIVHERAVEPGDYVRLTLGDTGCGMDAATASRVFEPFFTTKEVGKGTGLGLSTVYGIVQQSRGCIWVDSERERGTTFTILLPRLIAGGAAATAAEEASPEPRGHETVMLVEDDEAARELWCEMLGLLGYQVIPAANGAEALDVAAAHAGRIDVLLSDVVMPRLGGRELAERLRERHPETRVIFMSGYTADAMLRAGVSDHGGPFLQKPFTAQQLAQTLRETLESPLRVSPGAARA